MNINKKILAGIGLLATALGLFLWTRKAEPACTEGETKCEDGDLHACVDGNWELLQANSPSCPQPPECNEGDTKCDPNNNLYTCVAGEWQLTEEDSPSCKVTPPPGPLPEGFEIDNLAAEPSVVILGKSVNIKVTWFCPNPELVERTFSLECVINGEILQHSWGPTTRSNGSIYFEYTPASVGTYTATIPGNGIKFNCPSSVSFEVREEELGVYYCPFGTYAEYESIDALAAHIGSQHHSSKSAIGAGKYYEYISCPYCSDEFRICTRSAGLSCTSGQRIGAAYALIDHIQSSHPDHPLTIPRCHIETIVPEPEWRMEMGRNIPVSTYALKVDGGEWHSLGWKVIYELMAPPRYEYQRTQEVVISRGQHHVEIRGPVSYYYGWREDPYDTPGIFDEDVVLANLGDKAVFNVETGEVVIPPPSEFNVGVYYIWHYSDDYKSNWASLVEPGLSLGLNRFGEYMNRQVSYKFEGEFNTSATIGHGEPLDTHKVDQAIRELCGQIPLADIYNNYACIFFIFANSHDAFVYDYHAPIYLSDTTFFVEGETGKCLIEYELFHCFGLSYKTCTPNEACLEKDPEMTEITLCSYCQQHAIWENYGKAAVICP